MSEIEEIFASKGKKGQASPLQHQISTSGKKFKKEKRRKQKQAVDEVEAVSSKDSASHCSQSTDKDLEPKPLLKRTAPEMVVDPSSHIPKRQKLSSRAALESAKKSSRDVGTEDDRFKDSRGTKPRKITEEGWAIYKEGELGISEEGGDTPLCPFDCICCF